MLATGRGRAELQFPVPTDQPQPPTFRGTREQQGAALLEWQMVIEGQRRSGDLPRAYWDLLVKHLNRVAARYLNDAAKAGEPFPDPEAFATVLVAYSLQGRRGSWFKPQAEQARFVGVDLEFLERAAADSAEYCLENRDPEFMKQAQAWGAEGGRMHRPRGRTVELAELEYYEAQGIVLVPELARLMLCSERTVQRLKADRRRLQEEAEPAAAADVHGPGAAIAPQVDPDAVEAIPAPRAPLPEREDAGRVEPDDQDDRDELHDRDGDERRVEQRPLGTDEGQPQDHADDQHGERDQAPPQFDGDGLWEELMGDS